MWLLTVGVCVGVRYFVKDGPSTREGRRSREKALGSRSTSPVTLTDREIWGVEALDGESRGCFFRDGREVSAADDEVSEALSLAARGGCIRVGCIH